MSKLPEIKESEAKIVLQLIRSRGISDGYLAELLSKLLDTWHNKCVTARCSVEIPNLTQEAKENLEKLRNLVLVPYVLLHENGNVMFGVVPKEKYDEYCPTVIYPALSISRLLAVH